MNSHRQKGTVALAVVSLIVGVGCNSAHATTEPKSTASTDAKAPIETPKVAKPATDPIVDVVRDGMLANYNSTTLGKALEGTFQNSKWSTLQTAKGATVVQFDGTVTPKALEEGHFKANSLIETLVAKERKNCFVEMGQQEFQSDSPSAITQAQVKAENDAKITPCLSKVMDRLVVPVKFQFTLSANHTGFEISYIDMEPFWTAGDPFTRHGFEQDPQAVLAFIYR